MFVFGPLWFVAIVLLIYYLSRKASAPKAYRCTRCNALISYGSPYCSGCGARIVEWGRIGSRNLSRSEPQNLYRLFDLAKNAVTEHVISVPKAVADQRNEEFRTKNEQFRWIQVG